jgi:hypothetical protein
MPKFTLTIEVTDRVWEVMEDAAATMEREDAAALIQDVVQPYAEIVVAAFAEGWGVRGDIEQAQQEE